MKTQVTKSKELQVYQFLKGRTDFTREEKYRFQNALTGFMGERKLQMILKKHLKSSHIALYGLSLESKASWYQLDCLLIFLQKVFLLEVKNYKGEFVLNEENLYSYTAKKEYSNPLHQLQRSEIFLRNILPQLGANLSIESAVIFVNQEFTLFHAKQDPSIVLPTQINSFIKKLNSEQQGKINTHHHQLAEKITALHRPKTPYEKLPQYEFAHLQKGIFCRNCRNRMDVNYRSFICPKCTGYESIDSGILRQIVEFNILFPEQQITSGIIHEWIGGMVSKVTVRRVLANYLNQMGNGRNINYAFL